MSIENPKYFAAGDAGGGSEKNNEQKQAPEKKEIKIDPNNFDEEEIENIFKDQETTETTKTAKEEKPEEPQQTPEQQPKDEVEKFFVEQIQADRHFFSKDITPKEFRTWQEITQTDFKTFSEEKQKILMEMLANELGKNSNLIENAQKDLESKTIDKKEKDELEKGLKEYLQPLQKALRARTQVYHLALHPEKQPEKPPEIFKVQTETHKDFNKINELLSQAEIILQNKNLELEPQEKKEFLEKYTKEVAKILNVSPEKINLNDLIKMEPKELNEWVEEDNKENTIEKDIDTAKKILDDKSLDFQTQAQLLKEVEQRLSKSLNVSPDKINLRQLTKMTPEELSKWLNMVRIITKPEIQKELNNPKTQELLKEKIESLQKSDKESMGVKSPAWLEKAKETAKIGVGVLGATGGILFILAFFLAFFGLNKIAGIDLDFGGGGKGSKGGKK